MSKIRGWTVPGANQALVRQEHDLGPLGPEEVEVAVEHCGICHSDLSMIKNDWKDSTYPFVPGHEVVGRIVAVGEQAKMLKVGERVGIGWISSSCMHCRQCLSGDQHLCRNSTATMDGMRGGFAERVRAHWAWAIPLPDGLDVSAVSPLFCGGITVFSPFVINHVKPTDRVGIVGIGGLGHMAVKFAAAWGCEVTAFTSSESKTAELKKLGTHRVVSSRDPAALKSVRRSIDFLLVTVNVPLDWSSMMRTLAPKGRMHVVGAVLDPIPVKVTVDLMGGERSLSSSPTGSPTTMATMLEFAARHKIAPQVEHFPMSKVNEALAHLAAGKARYRVVLDADF